MDSGYSNVASLCILVLFLTRNLTLEEYATKTKAEVSTRKNILRKLTTSKWGAPPHGLRTTALVLSFLEAECACPIW